jgi:small subunit ribosomal protein S21
MSLAEVRLQEGESLENALRRFKRKVQTEDIIKEVKRQLLLPEAGREAPTEASLGAKACPKKDSQRAGLGCNN